MHLSLVVHGNQFQWEIDMQKEKSPLHRILFVAFVFGSILDFVMSILGVAVIFQAGSILGYVACFVFAFAILCLRLCIEPILALWEQWLYRCLAIALFFSILFDFLAVTNATIVHIVQKQPVWEMAPIKWDKLWEVTPFAVIVISIAVITFLVGSPMVVSFLAPEYLEEDEGNKEAKEEKEDNAEESKIPPKIPVEERG
jgi:hypothetical protein